MGELGAEALLEAAEAPSGKLRVLTHCNTGSLATAAYGTALGVVRSLHAQGRLEHAYCTETRPYNQGEHGLACQCTQACTRAESQLVRAAAQSCKAWAESKAPAHVRLAACMHRGDCSMPAAQDGPRHSRCALDRCGTDTPCCTVQAHG